MRTWSMTTLGEQPRPISILNELYIATLLEFLFSLKVVHNIAPAMGEQLAMGEHPMVMPRHTLKGTPPLKGRIRDTMGMKTIWKEGQWTKIWA